MKAGSDRPFSVEQSRVGDHLVLALHGELDLTTAPVAEAAITDVERVPGRLALDLRGLTFMDSTGVRVIVIAIRRSREMGHRLAVVEGPRSVQRVLELTGVINLLEVMADPPQLASPGHASEDTPGDQP